MGQVAIHLPAISSDSKTAFAEDTSYWLNMWEDYINVFQSVVIHCWNEETEAITELDSIAEFTIKEGLITLFTISLTEGNRAFLKEHSVDPRGGLKWFTLFFQVNGEERLEVGHYGSEIVVYKVDEEQAEKFIALFPESSSSHYYEDYIE
ncbi:hypothetical protein [Psychrobacillus sp.]|uniref:hypothetical protein n=1 Tax=Psychrobacillus sp. TaxID=1871623 RepID=UPI0028BEA644|nr:hypothetical protein [Psychrobacillus sp.]